jgi:hypothetical protein
MADYTYYEILDLPATAAQDEIKVQYRRLIQKVHPDRSGPAALFRQVQEAYETLSDPARRAEYDRLLTILRPGRAVAVTRGASAHPGNGRSAEPQPRGTTNADPKASGGPPPRSGHESAKTRRRSRRFAPSPGSFLTRHPAGVVALVGICLLFLASAFGNSSVSLVPAGLVVLVVAGIARLGERGAKERDAYRRLGMAAIDAMTGAQFEVLLEHFFATKGYRVSRLGGRGNSGADLLLDDPGGRTIVQAKLWVGLVPHDAVQQAAAARSRYGAARAMVVTSSTYTEHAVTLASSSGVTLWDRVTLANELAAFRGEPSPSALQRFSAELRVGSRISRGMIGAFFVALVAANSKPRRRSLPRSRRR